MEYVRGHYVFVTKEIYLENKKVWHLSIRPPMSDDEYDAIKYRLEKLGGHWRERLGGFLYLHDPMPQLMREETWGEIVHEAYEQWRITRQFYPTPPVIADRVFELAEITCQDTVLEPSAGRGALLEPIKDAKDIQAVEIDPENANILRAKGYNVITTSFENAVEKHLIQPVSRIVMNPPFSGQRDILHIMMAYDLLEEGGILVAIMAENDLYYNTPKTKAFNKFLQKVNAYVEDVPLRGFCESGTTVDTVIVKIKK